MLRTALRLLQHFLKVASRYFKTYFESTSNLLQTCSAIALHFSKMFQSSNIAAKFFNTCFYKLLKNLWDNFSKNASIIFNICFKCLQQLLQHCVNISFFRQINQNTCILLQNCANTNSKFSSNLFNLAQTLLQFGFKHL